MKKQILTLTMCLALTAVAAFADETKPVVPKAIPQAKTATPATTISTPAEPPKVMTREDARKYFEEKRAKEREFMYNALGLSAEQKTKAEALDAKHKTAIEPLIKNVHVEVKKLRDLKNQNASHLRIWQQKYAVKAAKKEVENCVISYKKDFEAILTKEQKTKFELIDEAKKKEINNFKNSYKHSKQKMRTKYHGFMQGPIGTPPADKK